MALLSRITSPVIGSSSPGSGTWWRRRIRDTVRAGTPSSAPIQSGPRRSARARPGPVLDSGRVRVGDGCGREERSCKPGLALGVRSGRSSGCTHWRETPIALASETRGRPWIRTRSTIGAGRARSGGHYAWDTRTSGGVCALDKPHPNRRFSSHQQPRPRVTTDCHQRPGRVHLGAALAVGRCAGPRRVTYDPVTDPAEQHARHAGAEPEAQRAAGEQPGQAQARAASSHARCPPRPGVTRRRRGRAGGSSTRGE